MWYVRATILICWVLFVWLDGVPEATSFSAPRPPASRTLLLAHYMPWYVAKPASPVWGWHWTMNAFEPDKETKGRRSIASHYYPLIGPYDSGDEAVLEYHLLLMKVAGIDGVVVDWYGLSDHLDYPILHRNTQRLTQLATKFGLKVAICYEDQTIPRLVRAGKVHASQRVSHAQAEIAWLQKHWFGLPGYVQVDGRPLFLSFGYGGLSDDEWASVLKGMARPPLYVSEHRRRSVAAGAFDWPIPKEHPRSLEQFYKDLPRWKVAIPVAFPRFHDVYAEGKAQPSHGRIADDGGNTWKSTLERALRARTAVVQLATWNDWGEGTGIEPTVEFGYHDLEVLQRLRAKLVDDTFAARPADLRLPHQLYRLRVVARAKPALTPRLEAIARLIAEGSLELARAALQRAEG